MAALPGQPGGTPAPQQVMSGCTKGKLQGACYGIDSAEADSHASASLKQLLTLDKLDARRQEMAVQMQP